MTRRRTTSMLATTALFAWVLCGEIAAGTDRPQTPQPPFPYRTIEVEIPSGVDGVRLAGALCLPPADEPVPAVLLLGVAGPNDRDLHFAGHRAFAVWADHLCRNGHAVLRWDDRGVGGSGGDWKRAGYSVLAGDVVAAAGLLRRRPEIDPEGIVLVGLSEGAAIAMMAAAADRSVRGVALLSPPGRKGRDALRSTFDRTLALMGIIGETALAHGRQFESFLGLLDEAREGAAGRERLRAFLAGPGQTLVPPYSFMPRDPGAQVDLFAGDWYQSQLAWDPQRYAGELTQPVLILGGDRDQVLPPEEHHPPLIERFGDRANVVVIEGASHLLQPARTGMPQEYATIETTVDPRALDELSRWLHDLSRPDAHR
jgi:uncharacterized protein